MKYIKSDSNIVWDSSPEEEESLENDEGVEITDINIDEKKDKKDKKDAKFADYMNFSQAICKIPSHRALALFRGRKEQILSLALTIPNPLVGEQTICQYFHIATTSDWLLETVRLAWSTKLWAKLELELLNRLREAADEDAIDVFAWARRCFCSRRFGYSARYGKIV